MATIKTAVEHGYGFYSAKQEKRAGSWRMRKLVDDTKYSSTDGTKPTAANTETFVTVTHWSASKENSDALWDDLLFVGLVDIGSKQVLSNGCLRDMKLRDSDQLSSLGLPLLMSLLVYISQLGKYCLSEAAPPPSPSLQQLRLLYPQNTHKQS